MSTIPAPASNPNPEASEAVESSGFWGLFDTVPAWGGSVIVHAGVFLVLLTLTLPEIVLPELNLTSSIETEEVKSEEEYVIDTEPTESLGTMSSLNMQGASAAVAQNQGLDNHLEEMEQIEQEIINPRVEILEAIAMPSEAEVLENIDLTGTTEHAGGTEGAVDQITLEIAGSLRQRRTMPVWLFDESISLEVRREEILQRFENVYRQLGLMDDIDTKEALQTGIIGFGKDVHVLLDEPTNDVEEMVKAVQSIQSDKSGAENLAAAIATALKKYGPIRRRQKANMMLIVVSDERGDDFGADFGVLEDLVKRLSREGVRVYCIGNTSPFGRQKGFVRVKWKAEDGTEFEEDIGDADQGPETPMAEGLQLPFWTANAQQLERMSSGYGPYALSRLCAETGGIFFVADDTSIRKWDPEMMRQYAPDYRPGIEYMRQIQTNAAKQALINAAQIAVSEPVPIPRRDFLATNDNVLREGLTEAQMPLAVLDYFLERVHRTLEPGEKHRDKLDTDRWRAQFDLAMGRILAMRVRAYGYNAFLAEMKSTPKKFEKSDSNQWILEPSEDINAGAEVRKMAAKAQEYLNRVVEDHPGTPWAFLAKMELSEPLGWKWRESKIVLPEMNNGGNEGPRRPQFAPEEEQRRRQAEEMQRKRESSRPKV